MLWLCVTSAVAWTPPKPRLCLISLPGCVSAHRGLLPPWVPRERGIQHVVSEPVLSQSSSDPMTSPWETAGKQSWGLCCVFLQQLHSFSGP
jgi:hypothetical protein